MTGRFQEENGRAELALLVDGDASELGQVNDDCAELLGVRLDLRSATTPAAAAGGAELVPEDPVEAPMGTVHLG